MGPVFSTVLSIFIANRHGSDGRSATLLPSTDLLLRFAERIAFAIFLMQMRFISQESE